jgi:hypothetical protein
VVSASGEAVFWIYLFFGLLAGITLALFCSPLVATVNTNRREFALRWTVLFRARYPLPGGSGPARIYLAGIPLRFPWFRRKPRPDKVREKKPRPSRFPRIFRFLRYCAKDSYLRRAVVVAGGKLARGSLRSFGLSRWHTEVSFPDPALNGMLAGWIAAARATRWFVPARWAGSPVGVNFMGQNWLELEVRFYPYRMVLAGSAFVFRLPHRAILRHWRQSGHRLASKTS